MKKLGGLGSATFVDWSMKTARCCRACGRPDGQLPLQEREAAATKVRARKAWAPVQGSETSAKGSGESTKSNMDRDPSSLSLRKRGEGR